MKITFFSPKTQFENVGDILINRELVKLSSNHSIVYIDPSRSPESFVAQLNTDSNVKIYRSKFGYCSFLFFMIFKKLTGHDCYYFLSPGGYFGEISKKQAISKFIGSSLLKFLTIFGVRVCLVGVSYERLGINNIKLLSKRSRMYWKHFVRDNKSYDYGSQAGMEIDKVIPDYAFNLFEEASLDMKSMSKKCITISFRVDQDLSQKKQVSSLLSKLDENLDLKELVKMKVRYKS